MTTSVWYLLASLLLASVAGQLLNGGRSRLFYENLESSSPAPQSSPSELQRAEGEELIIYLTSEQVEVLKAAGAEVQPLPELEKEFRENSEERTGTLFRPASTDDSKEDKEQDENNEALNIEQEESNSDENSSIESQSAEDTLEKSPRNYKTSSKIRQREYSTLNAWKKLNKGKSEYVRYLPRQEIEKSKSKVYRTQPRAGYSLEDIKLNTESQGSTQTKEPKLRQPVEIENVDEFRQVVEDIKRYLSNNGEESQEQADESEEDLSSNNEDSVTIEAKPQNPAKVWEPAPVRESTKNWKNSEADNKLKVIISNSRTIQRQYSSLSAPSAQQQRNPQRIGEQNEQLLKNDRATKTKLQQTTDDDETYAAEINKLKDIVKQIESAQKLSLEAKKPRTQLPKKSAVANERRRPTESENKDNSKPILVKITKPLEWRWAERATNIRPAPVQSEKTKLEKQPAGKIQRPVPVGRQYYVNTGRPYILQKEAEYKPEIPSSLAILQRIWDN